MVEEEQTGLEGIVEGGHDTNWVSKFIKDYMITSTAQFPTSAQSEPHLPENRRVIHLAGSITENTRTHVATT